jgi:hypothetical protein
VSEGGGERLEGEARDTVIEVARRLSHRDRRGDAAIPAPWRSAPFLAREGPALVRHRPRPTSALSSNRHTRAVLSLFCHTRSAAVGSAG